MSLYEFGRLVYRDITYLVIVPLALALMVFILTLNQPKEYASSALIYTGIASGFDIESGASDKVDYHAVNNAFDNLISIIESKQTVEEVLLRLLAQHMVYLKEDQSSFPIYNREYLMEKFSSVELSKYYHIDGVDSIYQNLNETLKKGSPLLVDIVRSENGPYGLKVMKSLEAKRHKSSDMLKLYYTAQDQAISKLVLELVIQVFTDRYRAIKVAETGDVVAYFVAQLNLTQVKLNKAEDKLTEFRSGKRVINYAEQTKAIAIKKQNALEEYSNKKMNLLATKATLAEIENKLKIRESLLAKNGDLLNKKNRLAALIQQLGKLSYSEQDTSNYESLKSEIALLKSGIQSDLETVFAFSNSKEGLPSKQLLNQWLENVIAFNREQVNVGYYKNRLNEIDKLYDKFAPLGSTLARLEREISVAEREYLEILNGLNMSKLRQQNIQLSSQLEIVDWPQFPTHPLKSKRKLLIIIGFLFGFISVLSILIAREMLDHTLSTPTKTEEKTGLRLVGAFPTLNNQLEKTYPKLLNRIKSLTLARLLSTNASTQLIVLFSANQTEGKSKIAHLLSEELIDSGFDVNLLMPFSEKDVDKKGVSTYTVDHKLNQATSLADLGFKKKKGITLLELPALSSGIIPYELIKSADESMMIVRADKAWTTVQSKIVKDWKSKVGSKPSILLNGTKTYHLEEFIGEIDTPHHPLIKWVRKTAKFELGNSAFSTL